MNFPTFPRFAGQAFSEAHDKEFGFACLQAYNDWMVEEWCADPRLVPITLVPFWDPASAAAEVRRNAARGVRAITFARSRPTSAGPPSTTRTATGTRCSRRAPRPGVVVCMHIGSGSRMPSTSADAPPAVQSTATFTNCMLSMCDWLFSGLLERYPDAQDRLLGGPDRLDPLHPGTGRPRLGVQPGLGGVADLLPDHRRTTSPARSSGASSPTGSDWRTSTTSARTT